MKITLPKDACRLLEIGIGNGGNEQRGKIMDMKQRDLYEIKKDISLVDCRKPMYEQLSEFVISRLDRIAEAVFLPDDILYSEFGFLELEEDLYPYEAAYEGYRYSSITKLYMNWYSDFFRPTFLWDKRIPKTVRIFNEIRMLVMLEKIQKMGLAPRCEGIVEMKKDNFRRLISSPRCFDNFDLHSDFHADYLIRTQGINGIIKAGVDFGLTFIYFDSKFSTTYGFHPPIAIGRFSEPYNDHNKCGRYKSCGQETIMFYDSIRCLAGVSWVDKWPTAHENLYREYFSRKCLEIVRGWSIDLAIDAFEDGLKNTGKFLENPDEIKKIIKDSGLKREKGFLTEDEIEDFLS